MPPEKPSDREPERLWKLTGSLRGELRDEPAPTIDELEHRSRARRPAPDPGRRVPRVIWIGGLAAAGLAGLIVGRTMWPGVPAPVVDLSAAEFSTGPSERVTVRLGDGTVIRLAPQTRLRVTPASDERAVWLDGQAFFAVARQRGRFVVRTHAGEAVALGTRFDLEAREADLRLVVVEGRVALAAGGERVVVGPNEVGNARATKPLTVSRVTDRDRELEWMGDFLVFQATPLSQAAVELTKHYGVPVRVVDSGLAAETVSGWFSNERLEDVLKILCRAVKAHCIVGKSGATIEP